MKTSIHIAGRTFREARILAGILEKLLKESGYKFDISKRSDQWIYNIDEEIEIKFVPSLMLKQIPMNAKDVEKEL